MDLFQFEKLIIDDRILQVAKGDPRKVVIQVTRDTKSFKFIKMFKL